MSRRILVLAAAMHIAGFGAAHSETSGTIQPRPLTYYQFLTDGLGAANARFGSGQARADLVGAIASWLTDKKMAVEVAEAFDRLSADMRETLQRHPGNGLLYDVGIYGSCPTSSNACHNQIKVLRGGAPLPIGMGATPAEAASWYLRNEIIGPSTDSIAPVRLDDSYMMWVTLKDGVLGTVRIEAPFDRQVWRDADEINKQWELRNAFYNENPELVQLVAQSQEFSNAAEIAERTITDSKLLADLQTLEGARQQAIQDLADAQREMQKLAKQAEEAQAIAFMHSLVNIASSVQKAGVALQSELPPISAEQAASAADALTKDAAAKGAAYADAKVTVRRVSQTYVEVHNELTAFYKAAPGFPVESVPMAPPRPMTLDPNAKAPGSQ